MIIGIAGYARSGKDTVADILVAQYGYSKRAFAAPIRDMLLVLNPLIREKIYLKDLVDNYGWDVAKGFDETRRLLQVFGTEVGRDMISKDLWVNLGLKDVCPENKVVFSDVRFRSEAAAITRLGGVIWRVENSSISAANGHVSESDLSSWKYDSIIRNNFSKEELEAMVISTMDWYDVYRDPSSLPA